MKTTKGLAGAQENGWKYKRIRCPMFKKHIYDSTGTECLCGHKNPRKVKK